MKIRILGSFFITILIIFSFVQFSNAESWKKEAAPQDTIWGDLFKETYSTRYCSVTTLTDGSGVNLIARGFVSDNSISFMQHQVQIRYDNNRPSINHSWVDIDEYGYGWGQETGPDLFAKKCARLAKLLPPQVKKQFFGYYGIK